MKILHIINSTRSGGGAQEMHRKLVTSPSATMSHRVVTLLTPPGVPLTVKPDACLGLSSKAAAPMALARLRRILRDEAPDVIVAWMYASCLLSAFAVPRDARLVWNIRHSLADIRREKLSTRLAIRACAALSRKPDVTLYCAQVVVPQHQAIGFRDRRTEVIANGFDMNRFQPLQPALRREWRQRLNLRDDAVVLGNAARWHPMKNHKGLLEAFAQLAHARDDLHLVLAGIQIDAGNAELAGLIGALGLEGRVTLAGLQADMPGFLGMLDLYVQPSLWGEGFPNVLGEAMACKTPAVTTDVGDSVHIVGGAGQIVTDHSADGLAQGISAILARFDAEGAALKTSARARVEKHFSLPSVIARYEHLLTEIARREAFLQPG